MSRLAPALGVSLLALAAWHGEARAQAAVSVEDWLLRDIEGKWILARDRLGEGTAEERAAWGRFLRERREFDLLEWLLVYTPRDHGWLDGGKVLAEAEAPHWVRASVWALRHPDTHVQEWARKALLERSPGRVLGWFEAHPEAVQGPAEPVRDALLASGVSLGDAGGLLPPLRLEAVLAHLDAPPEVEEFGDRVTAEPGRVYVHQVERAIDGMIAAGRLEEPWLGKHLALTRHPHPSVRQSAFLAMTRYPPDRIPLVAVIEAARDPAEDPRAREAAVLAFSYGLHPRAEIALLAVALDRAHPGWKAAVGRLGDRGDGYVLERLGELTPLSVGEGEILRGATERILERERAVDPARFANLLIPMLERAAWAEFEGDPTAPTLLAWTVAEIRAASGAPPVRAVLGRLAEAYSPRPEVFEGEEIGRLRERVRLLARRVLD